MRVSTVGQSTQRPLRPSDLLAADRPAKPKLDVQQDQQNPRQPGIMTTLTLKRLRSAIIGDAAIRRVRRMQPVGGVGDKIFPPTYPGATNNDPARHVYERRRRDGADALSVLIDSVQSQANRLEEALRDLRPRVSFPAIAVDFSGTEVEDIPPITTLDAPHRVFDAIIRDSELGGTKFKDTEAGLDLVRAKTSDATAVFKLSPTALVFGAWNSTGEGGGLGAKFPRVIVSEIVGIGVAQEVTRSASVKADGKQVSLTLTDGESGIASGKRTGSRIDPLGIRSSVTVYKAPNGDWSFDKVKNSKEKKPSEVNHSNIAPTVQDLGVTCDYVLHTQVLSCAGLRRLRFRGNDPREANEAARTTLAALGLLAVVAQDASGYFLRSRCDLAPEPGAGGFEIVKADGTTEPFELSLDVAVELFAEAVKMAKSAGLPWNDADLVLKPQAKLVKLVEESRKRALQGEAEASSEE